LRLNRIVLLTETRKLKPRSAAGEIRLIQPAYDFDWSSFRLVRFELFIREVDGAPDSWSLKPRLRVGITTTTGYQDTNPFWQTLSRDESAAMTTDGQWFPDLDETTPLPGLWHVTIPDPPAAMAIDFGESGPDMFTMTGGTDPAVQAALVAYPKA